MHNVKPLFIYLPVRKLFSRFLWSRICCLTCLRKYLCAMRVPCMYMCFNDKYHAGSWLWYIDHNGAWSVLLMGAISMVKEHNTNGGRPMSNIIIIIIIMGQILVYWFLITGLSPFSLFYLFDINIQHIPKKDTLVSSCVCSRHINSKWRTVWNSTCSWDTFPAWGAYLLTVFYGVILLTIPVPPGACCCTPDALKCMENNNLSQVCVDLFLWRQKQESNRCSITSEEHQNILSWIQCCSVLRTFSVFQLKVMKSLGALTACLAWAGMPLECPQCPPCPAAHPV